jgi:hypothetical protein
VASDFDSPSPQPAAPLSAFPEFEDGAPVVEPVSSASGLDAAPVPPTADDFDMLFGNAPIPDVQIGGDGPPAATDDQGFVAGAFIGREPTDATLDASAEIGATPPPFVTETMAELYLQQGFRDEALDVYRQLLAQDPGDTGLAERVRHLERGSRSSMAIDSASQAIEAAADAEELRRSGSIASVPAMPVADAEPVPMISDATPAFLVDEPAVAAPAVDPLASSVQIGPRAREVFGRIAQRRAVPGGGFVASAIVEPVTEPAPLPPVDAGWDQAPAAEAEHAPAAETPVSGATGGTIDRLFGMANVSPDDEGKASVVAAAYAAAPVAAIKGQPTYEGTDELSLNSVFHEDSATARPAPAVQRQSTKLRFDQFFAGAEEPSGPSSSSTVPLHSAPGKGEEDIAQFNDWLKSLKGS